MFVQPLSSALRMMQAAPMQQSALRSAARANHDEADQFTRSNAVSQADPRFGMLVLTRKLGEKIYIDNNICITVVDIDRGKTRLGIDAPRGVPIFRQELLNRK